MYYKELDHLKRCPYNVWKVVRIVRGDNPETVAHSMKLGINQLLIARSVGYKVDTKVEDDRIYLRKLHLTMYRSVE